jgi:energy-coupling factor transport system ATP-binding protein
MMKLFYNLNRKYQKTVLIVTHDMEQVFKYCDEVVVMANGKPMIKTDVKSFFEDSTRCEQLNILPPALIRMRDALRARGFDIPSGADDIDALAACIAKQVKHHG